MAHAEKCPVCDGNGEVISGKASDGCVEIMFHISRINNIRAFHIFILHGK